MSYILTQDFDDKEDINDVLDDMGIDQGGMEDQ